MWNFGCAHLVNSLHSDCLNFEITGTEPWKTIKPCLSLISLNEHDLYRKRIPKAVESITEIIHKYKIHSQFVNRSNKWKIGSYLDWESYCCEIELIVKEHFGEVYICRMRWNFEQYIDSSAMMRSNINKSSVASKDKCLGNEFKESGKVKCGKKESHKSAPRG